MINNRSFERIDMAENAKTRVKFVMAIMVMTLFASGFAYDGMRSGHQPSLALATILASFAVLTILRFLSFIRRHRLHL